MYKNNFTMGRDISFSPIANKMFHFLNQKENFSYAEEQIFTNKLFYFKTIDFGQGCCSKMISIHLYRLIMAMQSARVINLQDRKISFIENELFDIGYAFNRVQIMKNLDKLNLIAKKNYDNKLIPDKIKFILENINLLNMDEIDSDDLLYLENDSKRLNRVYKNICFYKGKDKDGCFISNPKITIKSKIKNIKRSIKVSKKNAHYKAIFNFADEDKISFLTITLAHHNKDETLSKEVKNLIKTKKSVKKLIIKIRKEYKTYLQKKYSSDKIKVKKLLNNFKAFTSSQLQNAGVWHFHIIFNIDLLKVCGYTNKIVYQKTNKKINSEYYENDKYYIQNKHKYNKANGWNFVEDNNLIVFNVGKYWFDIIKVDFPNLKRLNPRSQNLQIFYKNENNENKTLKYEIKECFFKKSHIKKASHKIVTEYVTKYDVGLNDEEIKKMILFKQRYYSSKNLFQFTRSCKKLEITKSIKYLPYDLYHPKYDLTAFYLSNVLDFGQEHIFYKLERNAILKTNKQKFCKNSKSLSFAIFEKHKINFAKKYLQKNGHLALSYGVFFM